MNTTGTCTIPGANRTGIPLPTKPVGRPEDDIVARLERAHSRPSSSPFNRDAPEFTRAQLEAAGFAVAGTKKARRLNAEVATRRDAVARLYVDDRLSVSEIAAHLEATPKQIRDDLDQLRIERDPNRRPPGRGLTFDLERAKALYLEGRTGVQVAALLGINSDALTSAFRRHGIRRPEGTPQPKGARAPGRPKFERAPLIEAYQAGASARAVAERFGCTDRTVLAALKEAGIKARPAGGNYVVMDPERVRTLYLEEQRTTHEIAEILGHTESGVRKVLHRIGIPLRDDRATRSGRPRRPLEQLEQAS